MIGLGTTSQVEMLQKSFSNLESNQYFTITINGVFKNRESLYCTPVTYNIVQQMYFNNKKNHTVKKKSGKEFLKRLKIQIEELLEKENCVSCNICF